MSGLPSGYVPVHAAGTVPTDSASANGPSSSLPGNVSLQLEITALRSELRALQTSNAGRAKKDAEATDWRKRGRALRRLVTMFDAVDDLIREAHRRGATDGTPAAAQGQPTAQATTERQEQNQLYRCYEQLKEWIPELIEWLRLDPDIDVYRDVMHKLTLGADGARADDTNALKTTVVSWLDYPDATTPRLHPREKAGRGFYNYATGRLLCPVEYDWDNAEIRKMIQQWHGDVPVTAFSWPSFLFPAGGYDPADANKGLFRGELLVKAYRLIFTGPSSVESIGNVPPETARNNHHRIDASTRPHNARLAGMKQVTPRSIAYVAVQLRFALSSCGTWRLDDDLFNLTVFYNTIIKWFEAMGRDDKEFVDDLMLWWDREIFGPRVGLTHAQPPVETGSVAASFKSHRTQVMSRQGSSTAR